jgi:hypothetical protein
VSVLTSIDDLPHAPAIGRVSLDLLMSSAEFRDALDPSEAEKWHMLEHKLEGTHPAFIESIAEAGVVVPVNYSPRHNALYNGHHRILIAWLLGLESVPYYDGDRVEPPGSSHRLPCARDHGCCCGHYACSRRMAGM